MGAAASRFFDAPSRRLDLVGVTGTSGKTTTTYMLASIFEAAGAPPGVIGTIGIFVGPRKIYSGLTTPESLDFESALADMERAGVRRVAAEISSIGLAEERVDGLSFRACVFTNLGRDHLDYHGTHGEILRRQVAAVQRVAAEKHLARRGCGGARRRSLRPARARRGQGQPSRQVRQIRQSASAWSPGSTFIL